MYRLSAFLTTSALAGLTGLGLSPAAAQANPAVEQLQTLLQRNNCTACHLVDKRKYGPTMNEVAARYAKDPAAATKLATKIKAGGSGVWGEDIMPPQPLVRDPDLKAMVELILALKPEAK
jgi:cytochrome c